MTGRDYKSIGVIMSRVDLKVVLLGSEYVGKTSMLERVVYDRFRENVPYQNVSNPNINLMTFLMSVNCLYYRNVPIKSRIYAFAFLKNLEQ